MKSLKYLIKQKLLKYSPVLRFKIQEESMVPILYPGDEVLVERITYFFNSPQINDLIVLNNPEDTKMYLLKRIKEIKKDKYFVVGDNLKLSRDSRHFGWIPKKSIIGKVY